MVRVRQSIRELEKEYKAAGDGGSKELTLLERVVKAFIGINSLPHDHWDSFWTIGGLHGAPFRGAGWGNSDWWGGYCNHGNILFPTWHRAYLWRLENALRKIDGRDDFALPFWDETEKESLDHGVPAVFGQPKFKCLTDGKEVDNPLFSYEFAHGLYDNIGSDKPNYSKPKGYKTVRYPLSGLWGSDDDIETTKNHNARFPPIEAWEELNKNVKAWLNGKTITVGVDDKDKDIVRPAALHTKYQRCLQTPYYAVFSNTTSATAYNEEMFEEKKWDPTKKGDPAVVALEDPHNGMHLAVGGCDIPTYQASPIRFANGDMGENDTAGLDPIFFFHHCWIDHVFSKWQELHHQTDQLVMEDKYALYPGTNSVDSQGPTATFGGNVTLTLHSPLDPFTVQDDGKRTGTPLTSQDLANTKSSLLNYKYGPSSLDVIKSKEPTEHNLFAESKPGFHYLKVTGANRGQIKGSFVISTYATTPDGKQELVGAVPILSRWHTQGCANCQTHLNVKAFVPVSATLLDTDEKPVLETKLHTKTLRDEQQPLISLPTVLGRLSA